MAVTLYLVFFWVPTEANLGVSQRIFYFHVPLGIIGLISIVIVAIASGMYLLRQDKRWDDLAHATAELGMIFATLILVTGAIWAKPVWGVWWTWDPKLTTTLILWFIYASYLMLRAYGPKGIQQARYAAVIALVGAIDAPIIYYVTEIWRNAHPDLVIGPLAESDALESRMDYLAEPLDRAALERVLGLDKPVHVQYLLWLRGIFLQGTLGKSLLGKDTVEAKIWTRVGPTFQLGVMSLVIGLVIALPVGVYSATRQDTAADYAGRTIAVLGLATPNFWLAIMVIIYPALWWNWAPPILMVKFLDDPWESLGVFLIPSIILGTAMSAGTMRFTRTMMLEVLRQDYVRTAWAKGLRERLVIVRHAIKNAMIPVVSAIGLALPLLVGGSVIIENIFNLPGMGQLMLVALSDRDYPIVSGVNLFFGCGVVLINLLIDLIYVYLDPRIRYQ